MDNVTRLPNNSASASEDTIDLLEIAKLLWKKAPLLISLAIVGAIASALYTVFFITPMYQSTSMIYVYSQSTDIASLVDLQIGDKVKTDFTIIATTRPVINAAAAEIGLDLPYEAVVKKVSITSPSDSRIMEITITDSDPVLACNLSNALAHQVRLRIADVMNTDQPTVVQDAIVPLHPVSPSLSKNTIIGAFALFALTAAVIIIRYLLDETIMNEEEVVRYLGVNVIATIPAVDSNKHGSRRKKKHKNKHKKSA